MSKPTEPKTLADFLCLGSMTVAIVVMLLLHSEWLHTMVNHGAEDWGPLYKTGLVTIAAGVVGYFVGKLVERLFRRGP